MPFSPIMAAVFVGKWYFGNKSDHLARECRKRALEECETWKAEGEWEAGGAAATVPESGPVTLLMRSGATIEAKQIQRADHQWWLRAMLPWRDDDGKFQCCFCEKWLKSVQTHLFK